jgi:hypothetical protein
VRQHSLQVESGVVDDSLDPGLERGDVEIDQETEWEVTESEFSQHLGLMNGQELLDRLELDDQEPFSQEIKAMVVPQGRVLVSDRNLDLTLERDPT